MKVTIGFNDKSMVYYTLFLVIKPNDLCHVKEGLFIIVRYRKDFLDSKIKMDGKMYIE